MSYDESIRATVASETEFAQTLLIDFFITIRREQTIGGLIAKPYASAIETRVHPIRVCLDFEKIWE